MATILHLTEKALTTKNSLNFYIQNQSELKNPLHGDFCRVGDLSYRLIQSIGVLNQVIFVLIRF